MLPSRERALRGLDYEAPDAEEYKKAQIVKQKLENEKVKVEMWQMSAGRYTQAKITYRGESSIVCLNDDVQYIDQEVITRVITDFYTYIDLPKTAILKKASANGKAITMSTKIEKKSFASKIDDRPGKKRDYVRTTTDSGLTQIGMEYNNGIYKERLIQLFAYTEKLTKDESIPPEQRGLFTCEQLIDELFINIYEGNKRLTVKNKVSSMIRYITSQGWVIKVGEGGFRASIYKVVENPFKDEMPAQAEPIDYDYINKSKLQALEMHRQN